MLKVLGIETSCDETAVAIVREDKKILSHIVLSQVEEHKLFGGVVPEIAARSHINHLDVIIKQALQEADLSFEDLDGIAATGGPGLIGGVIVGVMTAKAIASVHKKPFIAVNHLAGHSLTVRLTDNVEFPFLLLLVSGGHCQILTVEGINKYIKIGETIDDAVGEAFDKVAKMLGLEYATGAEVEKMAKGGDENSFKLPIPLKNRSGCDFSFSGLKTAVRRIIEDCKEKGILEQNISNICASFQKTVATILTERIERAMKIYEHKYGNRRLVIAGGVAANQYIKEKFSAFDYELFVPPLKLCTDNGAMIAWAGLERLRIGDTDSLDFVPVARWEL